MSYMSGRWLMKKKILIAVLVLGIAFSNVTIGTAGKDMPAGGDTFSVQEKLPVKFTQYFQIGQEKMQRQHQKKCYSYRGGR